MTITATLEEWETLVQKMPDAYPAWSFASLIKDAIEEIDKHYETEQKIED